MLCLCSLYAPLCQCGVYIGLHVSIMSGSIYISRYVCLCVCVCMCGAGVMVGGLTVCKVYMYK